MPWAMAPTSPVKGCCTRYDVRKAKSSAVLFWVRAFCSLLGAEIERVRCRLLRTLVNSIRVLLIIIVPLPSPSVISWVIYLCEGAEGWCESCDAHNSVSIFWPIVAFRKEYFSLIVQLSWRNFLYFSSTKAFFFPGYVDTVSYLQKFSILSYHVVFNISVFRLSLANSWQTRWCHLDLAWGPLHMKGSLLGPLLGGFSVH